MLILNNMKANDIIKRYSKVIAQANKMHYFPLVPVKAENAKVWDINGKEYIRLP